MANHFRLFGRPLSQDSDLNQLTVTGELEGYVAEAEYESRLQINNSIGRCTVEIVTAESNLPPGTAVRVDQLTKEVVVKWDAYKEVVDETSVVPNGDFENGDDGTWIRGGASNGEGWSIGTGPDYDTYTGSYSARFANIKTKGSDFFLPPIPAKVNDYIVCKAQVQQGASSSGHAGASVSIIFHDANGVQLVRHWGNNVKSGSNGAWHESRAEGGAPEGTASVIIMMSAYRNKENKPLWMDSVTWDHKYTLGQNDDSIYHLKIKVTDATNRVAYWEGDIEEFLEPLTAQLLPLVQRLDVGVNMNVNRMNLLPSPTLVESVMPSGVATGIVLRVYGNQTASMLDSARVSGNPTGIVYKDTANRNNAPVESVRVGVTAIQGITYKQHPNAGTYLESVRVSSTPTGITYG